MKPVELMSAAKSAFSAAAPILNLHDAVLALSKGTERMKDEDGMMERGRIERMLESGRRE